MAPHLTDKERKKIIRYLDEGKSQSWTAKKVGRSKDTIGRVGREAGIQSDARRTKRATEVSRQIRKIDRMEVISTGLDVGSSILHALKDQPFSTENVRAYKDAMTGVAIGIDKHRLETGEVTNRTENKHSDDSLEAEFARLDRELEAEAAGLAQEEPPQSSL